MTEQNPILIEIPLPVITPRLILRQPLPGDGQAVHQAKIETWEGIQKWMPWATEIGTPETTEADIREAYARFIRREDLRMHGFERESGEFVVSTGLHRFDWKTRRFEIGYFVRQSLQGKGYATETANALTRFAFKALGAHAVAISHAEGNEPSRRVIEKLKFEKEGIARNDMILPDGTVTNCHIYSLTDPEKLPDLEVEWR